MSLRNALLALLTREALTGYDLTKAFDQKVDAFWSAKHSQIYPELAAMAQSGLVTFELITQVSKPNKKRYRVTEAGRQALAAWLEEPVGRRMTKDPLLMRMWVGGLVPAGPLLAVLGEAEGHWQQRVDELRRVQAEAEASGDFAPRPDNPNLGSALVTRAGLLQAEAYLEWLRWAQDLLAQVVQAEQGPALQA